MNIDSMKNYSVTVPLHKRKNTNALAKEGKSAELCDNKNLNTGYYGGSFTGITGAAANKSETLFGKILTLCSDHTVIAQNLVALVYASTLRPAAIMSLPGKKDRDDKIYASGHSIASGLIGFAFSSLVMYPLGQMAAKVRNKIADVQATIALNNAKKSNVDFDKVQSKKLETLLEKFNVKTLQELTEKIKEKYKVSSLEDLENVEFFKKLKDTYGAKSIADFGGSTNAARSFEKVTKVLDMGPDVFIFGVLKGMLTVALIPPILKYVFGVEKKKPAQQEQPQPQTEITVSNADFSRKPELAKFAGGIK